MLAFIVLGSICCDILCRCELYHAFKINMCIFLIFLNNFYRYFEIYTFFYRSLFRQTDLLACAFMRQPTVGSDMKTETERMM